jgi:hypothetical protein
MDTAVDYLVGVDVLVMACTTGRVTRCKQCTVLLTNVVMGTMIQQGESTVWIYASLHVCMENAMSLRLSVSALLDTLELPARMIYRSVIQTMATVTRSVLTLSVAIAVHARMDSVL